MITFCEGAYHTFGLNDSDKHTRVQISYLLSYHASVPKMSLVALLVIALIGAAAENLLLALHIGSRLSRAAVAAYSQPKSAVPAHHETSLFPGHLTLLQIHDKF